MKESDCEFSYILDTARVFAEGIDLNLTANQKQKGKIAERFGLESVQDFSAQLTVKRINKVRLRLAGQFKAIVEQMCVVSLKPFTQNVSDSFSITLIEGENESLKLNEIDLDISVDEDEEYVENGKIDVASLVLEYFSLALDEFPHATNADFQTEKQPEIKENPFSVLEKLKF